MMSKLLVKKLWKFWMIMRNRSYENKEKKLKKKYNKNNI